MDFPRAWEISRSVPPEQHDPRCSTAQTNGALLCDCHVLTSHPEYRDAVPTTPPDPGAGLLKTAVDNGFFGTEQDALAEWHALTEEAEEDDESPVITGDPVVPGAEVVVPPDADVGVDPPQGTLVLVEGGGDPGHDDDLAPDEIDPMDLPDQYDLPMYGSILVCPKCSHERVRTQYHPHGVLSEPCGKRFGWPDVQNLGEHLCRVCGNCQYGWPEQVASGA